MKAESDSQPQLSFPHPLLIQGSSFTPKKSLPDLDPYQDDYYRYHNQMMLVETPVKHQDKYLDMLFGSDHSGHSHLYLSHTHEIEPMEEEWAEELFPSSESELIENIEPNTQSLSVFTQRQPKSGAKRASFKDSHLSTFKTPGRSHKGSTTPAASTTNKKKPCTCRKSNCLKKYCECFKAGEVCNEDCDCVGCKNDDPAMLRCKDESSTKVGVPMCNCRKSNCTKGYCDCHTAGRVCSQLCNCLDCKNTVALPSEFVPGSVKRSRRKTVQWSEIMEEE